MQQPLQLQEEVVSTTTEAPITRLQMSMEAQTLSDPTEAPMNRSQVREETNVARQLPAQYNIMINNVNYPINAPYANILVSGGRLIINGEDRNAVPPGAHLDISAIGNIYIYIGNVEGRTITVLNANPPLEEVEWEAHDHLLYGSDDSVHISIADDSDGSVHISNHEGHSSNDEEDWEPHEHMLNVSGSDSSNASPENLLNGGATENERNGIFYAGAPPLSTLPADQLRLLEAATVGSSVTVRDNNGRVHTVQESSSSSSSTSIEIEHIGPSNRQFGSQNSSQGCSTSRGPVRYQAETSRTDKRANNRRRPINQSDSRYKENPGKILTEKDRYSSRHTVGIRENKPLVIRSDSQDTVANRQGQEVRQSSRRNNERIRANERIQTRQCSENTVANRKNAGQHSVQSSSRHSVGNKGKQVYETRSDSRDTVTTPANVRAGTKLKKRVTTPANVRAGTQPKSRGQSTRKHTVRSNVSATSSNSPVTVDNGTSQSSHKRRLSNRPAQSSADTVRNLAIEEQQSVQSSGRHRIGNNGKQVDERRSDSSDTITTPANVRAGTQPKSRGQSTRKHTVRSNVSATSSNSPVTVDNAAQSSADTVRNLAIEEQQSVQSSGRHRIGNNGKQVDERRSDSSDTITTPAKECCSICLSKIGPKAKQIKCQHTFHEQCINRWLQENTTCPICRQSLTDAKQSVSTYEPSTSNESENSVEISPNESPNVNVHVAQDDDDAWEPYEHLLNDSGNDSDHSSVITEATDSQNPTDHQPDGTDSDESHIFNADEVEWEAHEHLLCDSDDSVHISNADAVEWEAHEHLLYDSDDSVHISNADEHSSQDEREISGSESTNASPENTDEATENERNGIFYAGAPPLSTLPADQLGLLEAAEAGARSSKLKKPEVFEAEAEVSPSPDCEVESSSSLPANVEQPQDRPEDEAHYNAAQNNGTNGLIINEQLQMVFPGSIIDAIDIRGRRYSVQVVDVQLNRNPPYMTVADRFRNIQTVYIERHGTDNNYITVRDNEGNLNTGRILRVLQPNQNQYLQQ
ncbi:hypothetical protein niasHT_008193 [Heterodera trifolii]|uniref:RING-type domain-containing protein n=1 Tax=Heterodera trifolii TaxID=157864 RepID=A0ABD2LUE6_9BILA